MASSLNIHPDFYKSLVQNAFDGMMQVDLEGYIVAWNAGAQRMFGFTAKDVIGTLYQSQSVKQVSENDSKLVSSRLPLFLTLQDGQVREDHIYLQHLEGYRVSVLARVIPIFNNKNKIIGALQIFNDSKSLIAAREQRKRVEQTIFFDDLTGIGNRKHIENRIKFALDDYKVSRAEFCVLFIDIDHFKRLNDSYGHLAGDKVLRFIANTLRHNLRATDSCGRWGGEEFLALILDINLEGVKIVAEKIRRLIEQAKIQEGHRNLGVTISIGASVCQPDDTVESIIQRTDELMYKSKENGRNRVTVG
ncbi:MAG TPA: diguanylate cyclase [Anaerolineales bacterium]|nr:diguanylate cyclase [Anaerolineales bacterium]